MTAADRAPQAPRRPSSRTLHGATVTDDYAWMRQTDDPELLAFLERENAWTDRSTADLVPLRAELERELAAALPDEDLSAPRVRHGWEHRQHRPAGAQYVEHVRRRAGSDDGWQTVLDENALVTGHDFVELGVCEPSPDGRLLAYSVDHDGAEVYELRVRDLRTGADLPDRLAGTYYGLAWAADSGSLLYTTLDDAYRPDTVRHHVLGTAQSEDGVAWHEEDRRFELEVAATRSGGFAVLTARSRDTTEVRLVPLADLGSPPRSVAGRVAGREYLVDHEPGTDGADGADSGRLVIVTDADAPEYRVVTAPVGDPGTWTELLPHDPSRRVVSADAVGGHVVVAERSGGRLRVRVLDAAGSTVRVVEPDGPGEVVHVGDNDDIDSPSVRIVREGWVRAPATVDHDLGTGVETVVHQQAVRTDLSAYRCEVVHATAADGTQIPVSVVRSPSTAAGGPCLLYGYGAYEASLDPEFWPDMLPLLDRGVTFAVAHVRGGGELGRAWWQQGRLMHKRTTFTDFVACAEHLVATGVTTPAGLAARGGSAGGLLMGAVAHLAPELFAAIVAEVPFVDVVTTMLDHSLPLTVAELEEWGDPRIAADHDYLASYAPYDQLPGARRPALLVTASRHDPRVSVHEPAKWVARMRADELERPAERGGPLLLRTALGGSAHTGPTGRYDAWRHEAFLHAFVLDQVGRT